VRILSLKAVFDVGDRSSPTVSDKGETILEDCYGSVNKRRWWWLKFSHHHGVHGRFPVYLLVLQAAGLGFSLSQRDGVTSPLDS
jgi:hypothetical protein